MKFILFTRTEGGFKQVPTLWVAAAVAPLVALGVVLGVFTLNVINPPAEAALQTIEHTEYEAALMDLSGGVAAGLSASREELQQVREDADSQLQVMSVRVAQLQARLGRMEATARQFAETDSTLSAAMDFSAPVAAGGPDSGLQVDMVDVMAQLELLDSRVADRERQLQVLENLVVGDDVAARLTPRGSPIVTGWLSSPFGKRTDPFNGKQKWHSGIDFAGPDGGEIISVADGIVSFAGRKSGYGLLIEVTHADGYATRYAHNKENLVSVGDQVVAGEVLARIGNTGRSTGPHVHFELLKNGKKINPWKVVASKRD